MDETFQTFDRVLSLAGINFFRKNNCIPKPMLCYQKFNVTIGLSTFVFTTIFALINTQNTSLLLDTFAVWTTGLIMSISLTICFIFGEDIRRLIIEMAFKDGMSEMPLIEYALKNDKRGKMWDLKVLVQDSQGKLLTFTRVLLKIYVAYVFISATLYILGPVYLMCVREDESLRLLAFNMWFPWSLQNFKVYVASFVYHVFAGYLCCPVYPGFQVSIILLVGQMIRQLRILRFVLLNLPELVSEMCTKKNELWHFYCYVVLRQTIDHYIKIKRFSNRLNVICQPFYLAVILVSIMLVCVCSVKIAISEKLAPDTIKYYIHGFAFVVVVLMFCLLGQLVENESQNLEIAVTKDWYIFNRQYKKSLLIFQQALSQKMPIYVFGSIKLELPTFTWFIKTGMSFFTLVMSVLEE